MLIQNVFQYYILLIETKIQQNVVLLIKNVFQYFILLIETKIQQNVVLSHLDPPCVFKLGYF